jgi:RNA polymerase sigma-70 factor (ECF subfamily)
VVQDTWLAVLHGIHRFEGRSSLKTWLFRILVHRARSRARREARARTLSIVPEADTVTPPVAERAIEHAEVRTMVESAIAELPRMQGLVVSLRDLEGHTSGEVCESLDISPANQRVLLHRARLGLRERLRPAG